MSDPGQRRKVELLGVPVAAGREVVTFCNDMIRELQLIELGQGMDGLAPSGLDPVAKALRADLTWLRDDFSGHFASSVRGAFRDATIAPDMLIDYSGDLLPEAAPRIQRVVDQFEELNWFSSHGQLLTIGASPIVMATVRWMREEVVGQLVEGCDPKPFPAPVR